MHKIKEMLMRELKEYEEKAKKASGGKLSAGELQTIHMLTDTVKNIDKIEMYEEFSEDGESYDGGSSYARGRGRGRGRNARRDSMGRYSRTGGAYHDGYSEEGRHHGGDSYYERGGHSRGSSYRGGYSYDGAKEEMIEKMEEAMEMAETDRERQMIQRCIDTIENA